jgi:hypothetical protein
MIPVIGSVIMGVCSVALFLATVKLGRGPRTSEET